MPSLLLVFVTPLQTCRSSCIIHICWGCFARRAIVLDTSGLASIDEERAELEAIIDALGRSSRLSQFLRYIGEKYLDGESDRLTEYNIAIDVFGRSKMVFDAGEDAIVRVETHRLRKRLKDFYEGPGKDHTLRMMIPAGSYLPVFTRVASAPQDRSVRESQVSAGGNTRHQASATESAQRAGYDGAAQVDRSGPWHSNRWILAGLALALAATVWITIAIRHRSNLSTPVVNRTRSAAGALSSPQNAAAAPAAVPVRLLAGYSGAPQTDSIGQVWRADEYAHGGGPWRRPDAPIARTSDPFIFQNWRAGDASYDIPLQPGVYELHLYFVSSNSPSDSAQTFTVRINGNLVLQGFDINSDAMGENVADERVFRDISPASDGRLHLSFASERGAPQIDAIEVLPGMPHMQLPIRLVMQRASFTDHNGQF
ncbi:MAG: malectin domain-containing carbohydrate-binding protein [Terriglobia bacterium]